MLCSHGVGTSHLEQAPSIKPKPSRISSRKAILLSRIAIPPLTPPTYYRACPRRAILLCRSEYGDTKRVSRPNFYYLTSPRPTKASMPKERSLFWRNAPMDIHACGSSPSRRGPADSFTGTVWQDPIIEAPAPARIRSGMVRFEPGARTHWHTHPLGQTLAVISGFGRVQVWGGKAREIRPGDVVWIPPGEKHWHGAGPNTVMVHVAMQEALDGKHVEWMEPVTDEQYKSAG